MNYYNEHDPKAAAWLRELIAAKLIPDGIVDERSITEIKPHELTEYTQCHFFAGIGGWSLALELAGWPATRPVWTGSCPCQPFSSAGQGKGASDDRHLWPVFASLIASCRPERVFGEQVAQAVGFGWLDGVCADLDAQGYTVGAAVLGAHSVGAPHIRQRLYWVADSHGEGLEKRQTKGFGANQTTTAQSCCESMRMDNAESIGLGWRMAGEGNQDYSGRWIAEIDRSSSVNRMGDATGGGFGECGNAAQQGGSGHAIGASWSRFAIVPCRDGKARRFEPGSFPLADGIPGRVGLLRGYGNAIVPETAAEFIMACDEILTADNQERTNKNE